MRPLVTWSTVRKQGALPLRVNLSGHILTDLQLLGVSKSSEVHSEH